MDRRAYLTALGAAAAAVSGCSEGDSTTSATVTTDGTPTPTERATATAQQPDDPTPSVTDAGLLVESGAYASLGDIDSVGQGAPLVVGVEHDIPVSNNSVDGLVEVRVLDSDGTEISADSEAIDTVVADDSEFHSGTSWFSFDTLAWEQGSYTAAVLVNDDENGTTASTEVAFDIVEPLGEGEAEMYIAEFPADAVARERFDWTLGFRNLSERDSSVVTDTVTIDPARADAFDITTQYRETIPAGEETTIDKTLRANIPGTYTYRIDAIDAEVTFSIDRPE